MKRFIILSAILFSTAALGAVGGIVAVVNDEAITSLQLEKRVNFAIGTSGMPETREAKMQLVPQILQLLIDETLQKQKAKELEIEANQEDLSIAKLEITKRNNTTPEQLYAFFKAKNIDPASFEDQLKAQILWQKIIGKEIATELIVTDEDITNARQRFSSNSLDAVIKLYQLITPIENRKAKDKSLKHARTKQKNLTCSNAVELAQNVKGDLTDLGEIRISQLSQEIREVVTKLPIGTPGEPVIIEDKWHSFLICDRKEPKELGEFDKGRIKDILEKEKLGLEARKYMQTLRNKAYIERKL